MKRKLNLIMVKVVIGLLLIPIGLTLKMLVMDNLTTQQFLLMGSLLVTAVYVVVVFIHILSQKTESPSLSAQVVKLGQEDIELSTRLRDDIHALENRLGRYMDENQKLRAENYQLKNPEKMSEELIFSQLIELSNRLGKGYSSEMSCGRCAKVFNDYSQLREHIIECQDKDGEIEWIKY
jgi:cell division protein FtsB